MVVGQPTPGAGMVGATGVNGVTGPKREYGISGSFDRDELDKRLADTRARVDAMLTNTGTPLAERLATARASTKGRLEDLNKMYDSPMELEAKRDRLNPRFDPYDAGLRSRLMGDYQSMMQSSRDAYNARDVKPERPSLSQLGAQYGATTKFGHKPYEQARLYGYEDNEILSYLQANPSVQSSDLFQELLSGNVNTENITSNKNRGNPMFRSIIGM